MHPTLNIAIRAARKAGDVISRHVDRVHELTIDTKARNDYVTEVDRLAEKEIISILRSKFPDHGILAEESGAHNEDNDYLWIIDPLDGTTNFIHGFPQFAVSIALQHKGVLEQAVVYDPISQELFSASRGQGAHLNNRRLRVTAQKTLQGALLGTGFPFRNPEHLDAYMGMFKAFMPDTAGIRRAGSAALDLAWLAAGRLDGFWEIGLNKWDIAAGVLLIREAGGLITDFSGGENFMESGNIVAGTRKLVPVLLRNIKPHCTDALAF